MSNPVTGPTVVVRPSLLVDQPGSFYKYQRRYKQKKPYNLALPYRSVHIVTANASKSNNLANYLDYAKAGLSRSNFQMGVNPTCMETEYITEVVMAQNAAREKFRDALGQQAMWLVNLAERARSVDMITRRAGQLYRFAKLLRARNLYMAREELKSALYSPKTMHRAKSKSFADTFLEYHFGWSPLVNDIFTSVDILQQPIPLGVVKTRGKKIAISSSYSKDFNGPFATESFRGQNIGYVQAQCGATVRVTNPNLWLANNMGLTNPATLAWELVPFSFVLDWFTTVGSFLQQWSDFHGLALEQAYTTTRMTLTSDAHYRMIPKPTGESQWVNAVQVGSFTKRELGVPTVSLARRQVHRLSVSRALTAISLLIQKGLK